MAKPIIQVKDLSVVYNLGKTNEMVALSDINVEIYSGEYVIIYGPSGCGKSTLLYSINGMESASKGSVVVAKQNLAELTSDQMVSIRRVWMGTIFQAYNLIPTLNVLDNVMLPQTFGGVLLEFKRKKAMELLEQFGIGHLFTRLPTELSGGQQQRVAIARALMFHPPILLADEPVGNLDSESADTVMSLIAELNEKMQKTIILVTHEPYHLHYAHRIIYMKDGRVVRQAINKDKRPVGTPQHSLSQQENQLSVETEALARVYPHLSEAQLQAKALTQFLLVPFSQRVLERMEDAITKRIDGAYDKKQMFSMLNNPVEKGGAGLYVQRATTFTKKIEDILTKAGMLEKESDRNVPDAMEKRAEDLARYLLDEYGGSLDTMESFERMKRFVRFRMERRINREQFQKFLDTPYKHGGMGFTPRTARNLSRQIELVLMKYRVGEPQQPTPTP